MNRRGFLAFLGMAPAVAPTAMLLPPKPAPPVIEELEPGEMGWGEKLNRNLRAIGEALGGKHE